MDSLTGRNDEKRLERETKRHKQAVVFTGVFAIFATVVFIAYLINSLINREYTSYELLDFWPRLDSSSVTYLSYNNNTILKYTSDGASAMDTEGNILWNGSYEFNNPKADTCGQYVVIADIGGKEAYVFNGSDSGTKITTLLPILEAEVAKQGVVALVLEDSESNEIQIYNPYDTSDSLLVKIPTNIGSDGYPVDISLSDDGKKLVTSYVAIESGALKNKITFYNFDDIGKDKVNSIVGAVDCGDNIAAQVVFLDNDTVCLMQEKSFVLYEMSEIPEEITTLETTEDVTGVLYNQNTLGYIAADTLYLYSLRGKKKLETAIDWEYDEVELVNEDIIFRTQLSCRVLQTGGSTKMNMSFDKAILYMFPTAKKNRYIFIDENNIEKVKLLEGK